MPVRLTIKRTAAYEAGKTARRSGCDRETNPYGVVERVTKLGTKIFTAESERDRSDWNCGWRDENDKSAKQFADVSSFKRKANRFYS